jgi:acyl-CoA thioester hydrolase
MLKNTVPDLHTETIQSDWIDYNGHMNLAYYVLIFDHATEEFLDLIGITEDFRTTNDASIFSAELHVNYIQEVMEGDKVRVNTQLIGFDKKRIHYYHRMYHADEGYLVATNELLSLYMNMETRKVDIMPEDILSRLDQTCTEQKSLPTPENLGSVIAINKNA